MFYSVKKRLHVPPCSVPPFFTYHLFSLFRSGPRSSPEPKRAILPGGGDARAGPGGGPRVVHRLAQRLPLTARRRSYILRRSWKLLIPPPLLMMMRNRKIEEGGDVLHRPRRAFSLAAVLCSWSKLAVLIVKGAWFCAPGFNRLCLFGYGLIVITVMTSGELQLNKHRRTSSSSRFSSCRSSWKHENFIRAVANPTEQFFLSS